MDRISKILVVLAIILATWYTAYRVSSCRIAGVPDITSKITPEAQHVSWARLVYPDDATIKVLNFEYSILSVPSPRSIIILPLPPGLALETIVSLTLPHSKSVKVKMIDNRCTSDIAISVYSPKKTVLIYSNILNKDSLSSESSFDTAIFGDQGTAIVALRLSPGAENNWYCNVSLEATE